MIIAGHTRYEAAKRLGLATAPVHVAEGLSKAQVKAYRIADNRVADAEWDMDLLKLELEDLQALDFDTALTAFDTGELDALFATTEGLTDPDACPEIQDPVTVAGDVWLMGKHRMLCGDSTDAGDVGRMLDGATPTLLLTDPPYGVELDMEWRDRAGHNEMAPATKSYMKQAMGGKGISGDTIGDWSPAFALVPSLTVAYVWHATSHLIEVGVGLQSIGFELRQQIIWAKTVAAMSRSAYHWKHEPCWYAVKKGATAGWIGTRDQTTLWEAASPKHIMSGSKEERFDHPTQKPVSLIEQPLKNHQGDVYEPFSGSGTTIIAAERLARCCYAMEIEPRYADVAVRRWEQFTGKKATLEADGRTFDEVAARRVASAT